MSTDRNTSSVSVFQQIESILNHKLRNLPSSFVFTGANIDKFCLCDLVHHLIVTNEKTIDSLPGDPKLTRTSQFTHKT